MTTGLTARRRRRSSAQTKTGVLIFDGDDTLWETEPLYDDARAAAGRIVVSAGVDVDLWDRLERSIDVENVALMGLSADRFPTSCVQAYERACEELGLSPTAAVRDAVWCAARSVFTSLAPVMPETASTLERLAADWPLILFTQGDEAVQGMRIRQSGLAKYFRDIRIVDRKSPQALQDLLSEVHADPGASWFIGNSLPSDVNPALAAGMRAIWIDAHVWDHERREDLAADADRCFVAKRITEVLELVGGDAA